MTQYAVPYRPGPLIDLPPHGNACSLLELREYALSLNRPLAIELFCGAGGLSLGLEEAGFQVILGVDHDKQSIATHEAYFGGSSLCADLSQPEVIEDIINALKSIPIALVASGPPCQPFSRAGINKIRSLKRNLSDDTQRELWRVFVTVVKRVLPPAIIMENVQEMALGENAIILRQIVFALEGAGYDVYTRILPVWQFGVPQHRQRLILVGVRRGIPFQWPQPRINKWVTVRGAISDLPRVTGGAKNIELPYRRPDNSYQRWCRRGMAQNGKGKIYDQIARAVRPDDLKAFRLMRHGTLYSDLPQHLRRYRADIFEDKYKRLPWNGLSRTITAHISKDGYWYIHPSQHRTLTVREAARIQTFPDRFRFAGMPSHAFRQIGEAVPPLFARALGRAIISALDSANRSSSRPSTAKLSRTLIRWLEKNTRADLIAPWRRSRNLWHILLGTVLSVNYSSTKAYTSWQKCKNRWPDARDFLKDAKRIYILRTLGLGHKSQLLSALAKNLIKGNGTMKSSKGMLGSQVFPLTRLV